MGMVQVQAPAIREVCVERQSSSQRPPANPPAAELSGLPDVLAAAPIPPAYAPPLAVKKAANVKKAAVPAKPNPAAPVNVGSFM